RHAAPRRHDLHGHTGWGGGCLRHLPAAGRCGRRQHRTARIDAQHRRALVSDTPPHLSDRERLRGVWAAMPTPWTATGEVDTGVVRELVQRYAALGLHGAYTTGTDGEMHVVELDDVRRLTAAFGQAAADVGLPAQIGCSWSHTAGVIERARIAREAGVGIIQVALPSWIPLSDAEVRDFFAALQL